MLELKNISKDYTVGDSVTHALKQINLQFSENEFVSILGASGCGKTTLLNLIGGLDQYTDGDIIIDGVSTKDYTESDWDTYRNRRIGFVFQNYNLIMHLSVLANVELALTLSGVSAAERKNRAVEVLSEVGLGDQLHKRPNQLSGGQMQRVAIARALVNNPDILLTDEPTGALDSVTSVQIMELLKRISRDRLIIMVTHNGELAQKYSTRIVRFSDGEVVSDSAVSAADKPKKESVKASAAETHCEEVISGKRKDRKHTSMSFLTALKLSGTNLKTKKARSIITAIAGSIGIIGVAMVLAISNGFSGYIAKLQTDALSQYPIEISELAVDLNSMGVQVSVDRGEKYPTITEIYPKKYQSSVTDVISTNTLTEDYIQFVKNADASLLSGVSYQFSPGVHLVRGNQNEAYEVASPFKLMLGDRDFLLSQFDVLGGEFPNELKSDTAFLIVDRYNSIDAEIIRDMGFKTNAPVSFEQMMGVSIKAVTNDDYYESSGVGYVKRNQIVPMYQSEKSLPVKICAVLRIKENTDFALMEPGFYYTEKLVDSLVAANSKSEIVAAQRKMGSSGDILNGGKEFNIYNFADLSYEKISEILMSVVNSTSQRFPQSADEAYRNRLQGLGSEKAVQRITVYPKDFKAKETLKAYLDTFEDVKYIDKADVVTNMMSDIIGTISTVLICFAAVSLIVSSIMIGVITYVSVVERTKEIGILRSIGARRRDIGRVFNAETFVIGLLAGIIGVVFTYLVSAPLNLILANYVPIAQVASLNIFAALILIGISTLLTMLAGLIPSVIAAKRDPVIALRSE